MDKFLTKSKYIKDLRKLTETFKHPRGDLVV